MMRSTRTRLAVVAAVAAAVVGATAGTAGAAPDRPGVVTNGVWELRNALTTGNATTRFTFGKATDYPVTGDWDGNGTATPGIVRAVGGNWVWYLRNSQGAGPADIAPFTYGRTYNGPNGDYPIVGDWDGDGKDGPGVVRERYRTGPPRWLLRNATTSGSAQHDFIYGAPTDFTFFTGDWDGNGTDTPALVRGGPTVRTTWLLRNSNSGGAAQAQFQFGSPSQVEYPVVGDWNDDGRDGIGLIREEGTRARWLLRETASAGAAQHSFLFGSATADWAITWR
jgi:hypothetical protein